MTKKRLFLAAPLSSSRQISFNYELEEYLSCSFDVFLPQREVGLLTDLVKKGMSKESAVRHVFERDYEGTHQSNLVVAVLDGSLVSGGVAAEIGIAFVLGKPCLGFETPARKSAKSLCTSPIIDSMLIRTFSNASELLRSCLELVPD
jgi:nucleoside 2-deoxyribosyltransferase